MRKIGFALLLILFAALRANGQSTTVGGTVTDAASQTWNNGTISFRFIPVPNYAGPYSWTGGAFNPSTVISANLNGSGVYAGASVPSNSAITPTGSKWQVTVCPQATAPCFVTSAVISGGSQTLNVTPTAITVQPGANNAVYATSEVVGAVAGAQIYVLGTGLETFNGSAWTAVGGGTVTSVTGTPPIASSGGTTPNITALSPFNLTDPGVFTNTQVNGPYLTELINGANLLTDFQSDFGHSGQFFTDAAGAGVLVPGGATVYEAHGVFGDVNTASSTTAAVALKGMAICAVTGCRIWGANTVATDGGFAPAFFYGYENNVNVANAADVGFGMTALGVWTAQPTVSATGPGNFPAYALQAPLLANLSGPSGNRWTSGLACYNGSTNICVDIGVSHSTGNPDSSGQLRFHSRNGSGTQIDGAIVGTPDTRNNQAIVPAQATDYGAQRFYVGYFGTAFSGADSAIVPTGWGSGAAVSAATGFDQSFTFTITAGSSPSANPTFAVTFKDGAWGIGSATAPGFLCDMTAGTGTAALVGVTTTSTVLTGTYRATPVNGSTYIFTCNGVGR